MEQTYRLRVLRLSMAFTHTLLQWPVFEVDIRLIEFKILGDKYDNSAYSGFIRDDPVLWLMPVPFEIQVSDSMDCCFVKPQVRKGNRGEEFMWLKCMVGCESRLDWFCQIGWLSSFFIMYVLNVSFHCINMYRSTNSAFTISKLMT